MLDRPLQKPTAFCPKCEHMKKYLNSQRTADDLYNIRKACSSNCIHFGRNGIYKGDLSIALVEAVEKLNQNLTPGRKPTRDREYGEAVVNLHKQGFSLRKIAETLNISVNTVRGILDNRTNNKP